jgi:hypothetical protein
MRRVELARREACVFPHRRLDPLRRVGCRTVGELLDVARRDLGAAPSALVFPERPLAFGLACTTCRKTSHLVKHCESVADAEVRCDCPPPGGMGPVEVGNRLAGVRLRALAAERWRDLGIPAEDLVVAESGGQRRHYLLPPEEEGT